MPDGSAWAYLVFVPSATATFQDSVDLQDGAGNAVYFRTSPGSNWLLRGIAGNPICDTLSQVGVPQTAAALWGMSETCDQ